MYVCMSKAYGNRRAKINLSELRKEKLETSYVCMLKALDTIILKISLFWHEQRDNG